ncbi:MAG: hypothetical protein N4A72_15225 [Bacteroidales bacterium]|jgi:uncharacterized protein YlbG (UPF0298 family)|nr:hypothetical protein [Bacteroidales bacterium]
MSKYKFLDNRDSAKANSAKPSGVSFNDNRSDSLQLRNLQRQVNSSAVVQKQADLQSGVNGVLQCYKEENVKLGNGDTEYVKITDYGEAIIFFKNPKELWVNTERPPEPSSQFIMIGEKIIYGKKYKGYKSIHKEGETDGFRNDCGIYATVLAEDDAEKFKAKYNNLVPKRKTYSKNRNIVLDRGNVDSKDYDSKDIDPNIREAYFYTIARRDNIPFSRNRFHCAAVVFKTETDNITSELNAGNERMKEPEFAMYRRGKGNYEGNTFLDEMDNDTAKHYDIRTALMVSPKRYYEELNCNKDKVDKKHHILEQPVLMPEPNKVMPERVEFEISSANDNREYNFILVNMNSVNEGLKSVKGEKYVRKKKTKNNPVKIEIEYAGKGREKLLLYISYPDEDNLYGIIYKYIVPLDIPAMLRGEDVIANNLYDETGIHNLCCSENLTFKITCKPVESVPKLKTVKNNVTDDSINKPFVTEETENVGGTNRVKVKELSVKLPEN